MFSIEIAFNDGVSQPETILVRRPQFLLGGSEYAHVAIEDMAELGYQIRVIRELGRRFRTKVVAQSNVEPTVPPGVDGSYDGSATFNLGKVRICVTALDVDLAFRDAETPDRAGARVMRQAFTNSSPVFPAVLVRGANPLVVSFSPDQPVYVGRLNQCAVRLESADVSGKHARIGFEGDKFWVEDLGSTNGTFVNEQQISGRVDLAPGVPIVVGREVSLIGVTNEDELVSATRGTSELPKLDRLESKYPVIVSISEQARPARLVLAPSSVISIGRDPSCEMWLGEFHISRRHCSLRLDPSSGDIIVTDSSTNGTGHDGGILRQGESMTVKSRPVVLDLGGGVTVGLCFSEEQESKFKESKGAVTTFVDKALSSPITDEHDWTRQLTAAKIATRSKGLSARLQMLVVILEIFKSASLFGKLIMLFFAVAAIIILGVVGNLLLGVIFR